MHIPSLLKIHRCLLKLSSRNEKRMDGRTTDGQTDGLTDDQHETIIPRHYCVAGYKNIYLIIPLIESYDKHRIILVDLLLTNIYSTIFLFV